MKKNTTTLGEGEIVTYKDFARKIEGWVGIVQGGVKGEPNHVWVRWNGELADSKELISELETV